MFLPSFTHTYQCSPSALCACEWIWEKETPTPFNELILSWNGTRPEEGKWVFWVSLRQGVWSPWLLYSEWASDTQKTFQSAPENSFAQTYQDAAFPKEGFCDAFRIKATAEGGADLSQLETLFACVSNLAEHKIETPNSLAPAMLSAAAGQSQMLLGHPRHKDLCSPTSTSNALNLLLGRKAIDPIAFAGKIHDDEFDIYGNWILNTAQAYQEIGGAFLCHVERLNTFADLHAYLQQNLPVVVSVRGPLPGAPHPYNFGHLICIIGYDPIEQRVHCIDPAFPDDASTRASYPLADFLAAWGRRRNIAYVFPRK